MSTYIEIHALQSVPPSCINRDDSGTPKTALYGGVQRARVSSQSWKRAVRNYFAEHGVEVGSLTKELPSLVAGAVLAHDAAFVGAMDRTVELLAAAGLKVSVPKAKKDEEPKAPELDALFMVSPVQVEALAELVLTTDPEDKFDKKMAQATASQYNSVDLALFGRMVASAKELNVDGASQVAHAIGITRSDIEFDFYVAIDDAKRAREDSDAGGGMMGTREFTEATLYRYAAVSADELVRNLHGDVDAAVSGAKGFVEAFVKAMPTGAVRSYGNATLPAVVIIKVRNTQPFNAASAFQEPLDETAGSITKVGTQRLLAEIENYERVYDLPAAGSWVVSMDGDVTLAEALEGAAALVESELGS